MVNDLQFDSALLFTLAWEGGATVTKDPTDPGGTTKWGISQHHHPEVDVENLTREQAKEIYFREYWKPAKCGSREWPLNLIAFDTAVNLGLDDVVAIDAQTSNWEGFLLRRILKHIRVARKLPHSVRANRWGWLFRCYDLYKLAREGGG